MSKTTAKSKANVVASYRLAIQGVRQILPNKTLMLNGTPLTSKAIIALLQRQIDEDLATTAAHAAWLRGVARARATTKATTAPTLAALHLYVAAAFGANSAEARAFGFQRRRPPKVS